MKKLFYILTFILLFSLCFFSLNLYADTVNINAVTDKEIVYPGTDVKLTLNFEKPLAAYTFTIKYDDKLFEYVEVDEGIANDIEDDMGTGKKVIITNYDKQGGKNPTNKITITFKAIEGITTSNPTQFIISATGLANEEAESYDDIAEIRKDIKVEPDYKDYTLDLIYDGKIVKEKEKTLKITTKSTMGKYYGHVRLLAKVSTPEDAQVKITGIDESGVEYDLINDGWGDVEGYELGGVVNQGLSFKGIFSKSGKYTLTLKLIDMDNDDTVISSKDFTINVAETENEVVENKETPKEQPTTLPKTGINIYEVISTIIVALCGIYVFVNKKQKAN